MHPRNEQSQPRVHADERLRDRAPSADTQNSRNQYLEINDSHRRRRQQSNGNAHHMTRPHRYQDFSINWHPVARPWEVVDAEAYRVVQDPALNPRVSIGPTHHHQTNQLGEAYPSPHHRQHRDDSVQFQQSNSEYSQAVRDPLNLSGLRQLQQNSAPVDKMSTWMNEAQREGAWNAIGQVRVRRNERNTDGSF